MSDSLDPQRARALDRLVNELQVIDLNHRRALRRLAIEARIFKIVFWVIGGLCFVASFWPFVQLALKKWHH